MNNKPSGPKPSFYERLVKVHRQHPVLMNILYIIIAAIVLVWLLLMFLDSWTRHGDEAVVPALKGQSIELASMTLDNEGFKWEVMDSVFESTQRPGTIVEQNPRAGACVKPGRTVYLTIVAFSPKMVTVPDFMNVSRRQGRSMFEGLGLTVNIVTVPSQYKDLVLGAKMNGVPLRPGQRIPVTSKITLEVGGGENTEDADSAFTETDYQYEEAAQTSLSVAEEEEDPTVQLLMQD